MTREANNQPGAVNGEQSSLSPSPEALSSSQEQQAPLALSKGRLTPSSLLRRRPEVDRGPEEVSKASDGLASAFPCCVIRALKFCWPPRKVRGAPICYGKV